MATKTISKCAECSYPLAAENIGERVTCPMCGTVNEVIAQGITIPTPLFVGVITFGLGVLFGPALLALTDGGRRYLEEQARGVIRG